MLKPLLKRLEDLSHFADGPCHFRSDLAIYRLVNSHGCVLGHAGCRKLLDTKGVL